MKKTSLHGLFYFGWIGPFAYIERTSCLHTSNVLELWHLGLISSSSYAISFFRYLEQYIKDLIWLWYGSGCKRFALLSISVIRYGPGREFCKCRYLWPASPFITPPLPTLAWPSKMQDVRVKWNMINVVVIFRILPISCSHPWWIFIGEICRLRISFSYPLYYYGDWNSKWVSDILDVLYGPLHKY